MLDYTYTPSGDPLVDKGKTYYYQGDDNDVQLTLNGFDDPKYTVTWVLVHKESKQEQPGTVGKVLHLPIDHQCIYRAKVENTDDSTIQSFDFDLVRVHSTNLGATTLLNKDSFEDELAIGSTITVDARYEFEAALEPGLRPVFEFSTDNANWTEIENNGLNGRALVDKYDEEVLVAPAGTQANKVQKYRLTITSARESDQGFYRLATKRQPDDVWTKTFGDLPKIEAQEANLESTDIWIEEVDTPRLEVQAIASSLTSAQGLILTTNPDVRNVPDVVYSWQFRKNKTNDWTDIPGAGSPRYDLSLAEITTDKEGFYRLSAKGHRIKGKYKRQSVSSNEYELRLENVPFHGIVNTNPTVVNVNAGDSFTLGIANVDTAKYEITWSKAGQKLPIVVSETQYDGVTDNDNGTYVLLLKHRETSEVREYSYDVTVTMPVTPPPATPADIEIPLYPFNLNALNLAYVVEGDVIDILNIMSVDAESYQWYHENKNGEITAIDGETNKELRNFKTTAEFNHKFFVRATFTKKDGSQVVRDSDRSVIADFAYRPVIADITVKEIIVNEGEPITMTVDIQDDDKFTHVRWEHAVPNGQRVELTTAADLRTLTIDPSALSDAGNYYCVVTRFTSDKHVKPVVVTVNEIPKSRKLDVIITSPQDDDFDSIVTLDEGQSFSIVGEITNKSPLTKVQWKRQAQPADPIENIPGAESTTYSVKSVTVNDVGIYLLTADEQENGSTGISRGIKLVVRPPLPTTDDQKQKDIKVSTPLQNAKESAFTQAIRASITAYCNAMFVNKKIDPYLGLSNQRALYDTILRVVTHEDPGEFMSAMDVLVDKFFEYRQTVFAPEYRARFLEYATANEMSYDEQETFIEFVNAFSWMAYPNEKEQLPWVLSETKDIIGNGVLYARFVQYYDRKLNARFNADGTYNQVLDTSVLPFADEVNNLPAGAQPGTQTAAQTGGFSQPTYYAGRTGETPKVVTAEGVRDNNPAPSSTPAETAATTTEAATSEAQPEAADATA